MSKFCFFELSFFSNLHICIYTFNEMLFLGYDRCVVMNRHIVLARDKIVTSNKKQLWVSKLS